MTESARVVEMDTIPSMGKMLLRAATTRKPAQSTPQFRPLTIRAQGVTADPEKLAKFRAVCAYPDSDTLPLTYPQVMAFALHMQMMLEPEFPYTPAGSVHIRNRIRQNRAVRTDERLDFAVHFGGATRVDKGHEVSIVTEVRVDGELVWDGLSVMLVRKGGTGGKKEKRPPAEAAKYKESVTWKLAADKGRQYAAASGDYNPIHLYPWSARLMGFKRQIMHGMWSKSRAVAHLLPGDHDGAASVDVAFKLPIFLPATVQLMYNQDATGARFEMKDGKGEKPHLAGELVLGRGI